MSASRALLGKSIDLLILLNELLDYTLCNYVPMAKKKLEKKESVDVASLPLQKRK